MLLWALWLAAKLVRWTGWAWRSFSEGGLWQWPARPDWTRGRRAAERGESHSGSPATAPSSGGSEPDENPKPD
jgi:hypothetical protein